MPIVQVRENESFDAAMRRFKRACEKEGVLAALRRKEYYEKPTARRKRKDAAAKKRQIKRMMKDKEVIGSLSKGAKAKGAKTKNSKMSKGFGAKRKRD